MRKPIAAGLSFMAALAAGGAAAQDAQVSKVELIHCGIYVNELLKSEKDAASPTGTRRVVDNNRLVRETRQIPATLGTSFGCEVVLHGTPKGAGAEFVAVMRLPAVAAREPLRGSRSYPIGDAGYVGYTFRSEGNLIAGAWVLEIWVDGKKLADASFTMTR